MKKLGLVVALALFSFSAVAQTKSPSVSDLESKITKSIDDGQSSTASAEDFFEKNKSALTPLANSFYNIDNSTIKKIRDKINEVVSSVEPRSDDYDQHVADVIALVKDKKALNSILSFLELYWRDGHADDGTSSNAPDISFIKDIRSKIGLQLDLSLCSAIKVNCKK